MSLPPGSPIRKLSRKPALRPWFGPSANRTGSGRPRTAPQHHFQQPQGVVSSAVPTLIKSFGAKTPDAAQTKKVLDFVGARSTAHMSAEEVLESLTLLKTMLRHSCPRRMLASGRHDAALSFAMGAVTNPRCSKSILIEAGNALCNFLREVGAQERFVFCGARAVACVSAVLGHVLDVSDEKVLISQVGVIQGLCSVKIGRRGVWKVLVGEGACDDDEKENSAVPASTVSIIEDFFTKLCSVLELSKSTMLLQRLLGLLANASSDTFGQRYIGSFQYGESTFAEVIQKRCLTGIPDRQVVLSALSVLSHIAERVEWSQPGWQKVCDLVGCGDVGESVRGALDIHCQCSARNVAAAYTAASFACLRGRLQSSGVHCEVGLEIGFR